MSVASPSDILRRPAGTPEAGSRAMIILTVVLCCAAPLVAALSRSGKAPPEAYYIFQRLFFFNDYAGSLAMLAALAAVLALPKVQEAAVRLAEWVGDHPGRTIAAAFVVLALCSRFVYLAHPLSMDEYAPMLQAHAFARGELKVHYPPELIDVIVPKQFQGIFIGIDRQAGDVVSMYWPALALVMSPFVRLGIEWFVNPAFGALALAMLYLLARQITGSRAAGGWAMLLALASPQFTVNAISFYAMPGELALNLLFLWLVLRPGFRTALAAGLVGGVALAMHNPVPHGVFALPCLVWLAARRERWGRLLAVLLGYIPPVLLLAAGWATVMATTSAGQAGSAPAGLDIIRRMGYFVVTLFAIPDDLMLANRWYAVWKTWIWACPGLLLLLFLPRRRSLEENLLIAAFAGTFAFYFFVRFDQGHGWGNRYLHTAWAALPVAGAAWVAGTAGQARRWAGAMVAAGLLATPVFMWQTQSSIRDALSYRLAPAGAGGEWVVFVAQDTGRYRGDLVQNYPGRTSLLYLVSRGEAQDRSLMERFFPGSQLVEKDRRGSAWRLPEGSLAERMNRAPPLARSQR